MIAFWIVLALTAFFMGLELGHRWARTELDQARAVIALLEARLELRESLTATIRDRLKAAWG